MKLEEMVNKVICGDSLEVLKTLPDSFVDCVVTSPPYNKGSANRSDDKNNAWRQAGIDYELFNDDLDEKVYQDQQKQIIKECLRVLKPTGSIFYNHKPRIVEHRIIFPHEWLANFNIRQMIIWDRGSAPNLDPIRFMPTTEYIFWITKQQATPKFNPESFKYKEIWRLNFDNNNPHPAPFPIDLPSRCISATTDKGDLVLDPYAGSGTTLLAARNLGRNYLGIELNPKYIEMANDRLKQGVLNF